jgi:hypothetical protein
MKRLLLLSLLLLFPAGCTTFKEMQSSAVHRYDARRKLSSALKDLEQGRAAAASFTLEEIVAEPGIKGITDEALFRLSLLKLHDEEKDGVSPAVRYLERLRHEYADSVWMLQSRPLLDFLNAAADVKKQNRNLKNLNNSLTKDNKELHQNIDRLKKLDLQLERKTR